MATAKILQWPRLVPLLRSRSRARTIIRTAEMVAHEIAEAGKLSVIDWDPNPPFGVHARLLVEVPRKGTYEKERKWWVNIRPSHFPGPYCKVPAPRSIRGIEFLYTGNKSGRHHDDPTSYLSIKPELW